MKYEFTRESIRVDIKIKIRDAVCSAELKFNDLLFAVGLSTHKDQIIMIKIEVDLRPPPGFKTELTVISKEHLIAIHHFDLPSLFAGKLHAILQRRYTKGRDYYDYLWYQGKKIKPNIEMLNYALEQSTGTNPKLNEGNLKTLLQKQFSETNYDLVKKDLEPFLIDTTELRFFTKEIFLSTV